MATNQIGLPNIPSWILEQSMEFRNVLKLVDEFPNDGELGKGIRKLISEYRDKQPGLSIHRIDK